MVFPVTYLVIITILFDIPLLNVEAILLFPSFYLVSALSMLAGYGLWEMRHWAWYLILISGVLTTFESARVVHSYGESHYKALAFLASLLLWGGLVHRISKEMRVPYFFPKIRWWETNPRYKLSVPVRIQRSAGGSAQAIDGEILDLSIGGCFIKLRTDLELHELLCLGFQVFGLSLDCEGVVVWRTQSGVTHPKGVGVKFAIKSRAQKRKLRQVNGQLQKIAQLYRRSRYLMSQEEFIRRLDEIEHRRAQGSA